MYGRIARSAASRTAPRAPPSLPGAACGPVAIRARTASRSSAGLLAGAVERQLHDAREARGHRAAGDGGRVLCDDLGACALRAAQRPRAVGEHRAHAGGGMVEVGLGPFAVGGIRVVAGADRHHPRVDGQRVERRHEVARAAVVGRDDRRLEQHRLGDRQAEALRAVQRDVAVQLADERVLVLRREVRVDHGHAGLRAGRRQHRRVLGGPALAAERLEHEADAVVVAEGARERLDQAERVLARGDARVVEDEAEEEACCGSPSASRPAAETTGSGTGIGTWTTGTGATAANTSATKRDPAQTSSTRSNARSQRPARRRPPTTTSR